MIQKLHVAAKSELSLWITPNLFFYNPISEGKRRFYLEWLCLSILLKQFFQALSQDLKKLLYFFQATSLISK